MPKCEVIFARALSSFFVASFQRPLWGQPKAWPFGPGSLLSFNGGVIWERVIERPNEGKSGEEPPGKSAQKRKKRQQPNRHSETHILKSAKNDLKMRCQNVKSFLCEPLGEVCWGFPRAGGMAQPFREMK